jgi:hypothetical protein
LLCYPIGVRIRFLDSRSMSKYLIRICILPQNLFVSTVGNSPTLSGESGIAWFIRLRVQPPDRLAFWGSVGPKDLKPAAICTGACVATRQPGWARRVCGRPRRTRHVSAIRFQHQPLVNSYANRVVISISSFISIYQVYLKISRSLNQIHTWKDKFYTRLKLLVWTNANFEIQQNLVVLLKQLYINSTTKIIKGSCGENAKKMSRKHPNCLKI